MIPIKHYIDERIDALNALDAQMLRWMDSVENASPEALPHFKKVHSDFQLARDAADKSLLDLFSIRSAEFATAALTANVEAAWGHLQGTWRVAQTTFSDFESRSDVLV